jgi:signal transduction histidine kinase
MLSIAPTQNSELDHWDHARRAGEVGLWRADLADGSLVLDERACALVSEPKAVFSLRGLMRLLHREDRKGLVDALRRALGAEGSGVLVSQFRVVASAGRPELWLGARGRVGQDADGRGELAGALLDLSEHGAAHSFGEWARRAGLAADVGVALTHGSVLSDQLRACAEAMVSRLDAAFARIWVLNEREQILELVASAGLYTHLNGPHGRVPVGSFKIGRIAQERKPHLSNDVQHDSRVSDKAWAKQEGMVAFAGYPLVVEGKLVGVVAMFAKKPLTEAALRALGSVADSIALGIGRKHVDEARERLIAALNRKNQELDQFAYVASHDLKAPLRGIANLAQWIEEDIGASMSEEARSHMQLLQGRVHRLEALIDGILSYSRAGRVHDQIEEVDTGELVAEVIELLGSPPGVTFQVAEKMPIFRTERVPLQQVFMNLLSNAVKHARREGAEVSVGFSDKGLFYEFSVKDNGQGIAAEFQERIWTIFQTLESRDRVEGTGIGLSVVRKLAETRGGRSYVSSTPGQGATFYVTWPKYPWLAD